VTVDPQELRRRAEELGIEFYFAQFVDMYARPSAKLVPAAYWDDLITDGAGFAGFAAGEIGQGPHHPDISAVPDLSSFTHVPWQPNLGRFACDIQVDGEEWPYDPRTILRHQLERARAKGFEFKLGVELEYFLLHRGEDGTIAIADTLDTLEKPCYDLKGLTRNYDFLTTVSRYANQLGWGNYANDHEDANGQFEQNFAYADALTTADRVITARYLISVLAEQRGMTATFMPKPFADRTGSGMHLHLSLWRDGSSRFPDADDPRGFGLSELAYRFLGGVLEHATGMQAVLAPTVNSYKRTGARSTRSGATWSPRRPTYGGNDRTHFVRIPDGNRIELRGGDGAANPYLALAVALGAGLDGVTREVDPGEPGSGEHTNGRPELPPTLLHAVEALESDPVVTAALDAAGPGVGAYFAAVKREEFFDWHATVGSWEHDRYLTAF
jgi:glutamine synthetase